MSFGRNAVLGTRSLERSGVSTEEIYLVVNLYVKTETDNVSDYKTFQSIFRNLNFHKARKPYK